MSKRSNRSWLGLVVVALALLFTSRSALAQSGVRVYLTAKPADPANPKTKGQAPSVEATIINGSNVPFDKCTITQTGGKAPVTLKAISKREYTEGTDTIAIALVINGQEVWVGNDKVEPDPSAQYKGVLDNLSSAIDQLKLGEAGPPGSKGIIVSYSTGAEVKMPMSPLGSLNGSALGSQKDYRGKIGTDMVQGISMGIGELSKVSTVRKALIVVGDGTDTNNDEAATSLTEQRKLANKNGIDLFAVIYKSELSSPNNVITKLIPNAKTVNSIEGIKAEMTSIIEQMKDRYYLTFPGYDPKLGVGLTWDGKEHDLVVKIDQTELDAVPLAMVPKWSPPSSGGFPVWAIILIVVAVLLLLVVIGAKVFGSKAEPMPAPAPMPVVAAPAPVEAPKPLGPVKTVMIGQGGDEGGFPVVGWLVPLNGKHAYQTFRLRGGGTKIGTAPPADIVVDDGFMSTDHCHIHCSPSGFSLVDPGSTNGCYVNDRRVQKHDLVDNDMITLGKTSFKFKSIV